MAVGIYSGIYSVNEARARLGLNPINDGDEHLVNGAMLSLKQAGTSQPAASSRDEKRRGILTARARAAQCRGPLRKETVPSNQIDYANEIQALWKQPYERVNQATRDGHEIKGDLFVETMRRILPEPAVNEPPPTHLYEPLRRLLREAIADIDRRYSRGREW